nr:MAG TPA: hypothetical protein [Caudoviricetes sp.]
MSNESENVVFAEKPQEDSLIFRLEFEFWTRV